MANEEPPAADERILVLNPVSGDGTHVEQVTELADEHGFEVRRTESAADIVETTADAAREADLVGVAGGDGTLTRAVRGFDEADAFADTLFGVVPAGTGNNFAGNVGVPDVPTSFEVMEHGVRRRVDVGTVDGTPFLNSCVAGLTAEASAETDSAEKERWGVLAYAAETVRTATAFDGLRIVLDPVDGDPVDCRATLVMIGNGRGFPRSGGSQANLEDGLLEVTVVEEGSMLGQLGESVQHWFGADVPHLREFRTADVSVSIEGEYDRVSVDGEITRASELDVGVRPATLWLPVGATYEPVPERGGESGSERDGESGPERDGESGSERDEATGPERAEPGG